MEASEYVVEDKVERDHWWFVGRRAVLRHVLQALCDERGGGKFAYAYDIGCGVGNHQAVISRYALRTVGVESNAQAAAFARAKDYDEVLEVDINDSRAGRLNGTADLIVLMDVLEHIEDDAASVRQLYGFLKPGGKLVMTVPAFASLWGIQDEVGHHYRRYRLPQLKRILESAGFRVRRWTYFNTFLFLPIYAARQVTKSLTAKRIVSENSLTGPLANAILRRIFLFEVWCIRHGARFPFGVSALAVAEKPSSARTLPPKLESLCPHLRCPSCGAPFDPDAAACASCGREWTVTSGVPNFLTGPEADAARQNQELDAENAFKNFFKRWPNLYRTLVAIVAPSLFIGLTDRRFVSRIPTPRLVLNLGSGASRLADDVVNLDLYPFSAVDIVADASRLPFADATFDAVTCDQVLEHVPDPDAIVAEFLRVLKPGGLAYAGVPYIYPRHPSPKDYVRWTREGLCEELGACDIVESGILLGPTSGFLVVLAMWLATIFSFGINPLRKGLNYVFMIILSPFKLLDYLFTFYPGAEDIAAGVYVVGRKKIL